MRGKTSTGLTLYKRHGAKCEVHRTKLSESAKKFFWACGCPIWITGAIPGTDIVLDRQTTGKSDLRQAEAVRDAWIADAAKEVTADAITGPSLAACIEQYLESRETEVVGKTHEGITRALKRFAQFCRAHGVMYVRELTVDTIERFKIEGLADLERSTRLTVFQKITGFLRDAYRRAWITEPLADKVRRPVVDRREITQPFTDKEIDCIMSNAERISNRNPTMSKRFASSPATFRLLLELMLATGMRVGDAIRFDPASLERGDSLWIYHYTPQKQRLARRRKEAEAYITDALKTGIDRSVWMTPGEWPFYYGPVNEAGRYYVAAEVGKLMKSLGKRCGIADCHPHRLRDTFAVRCLLAGMPLEDVSRLLNHSSVIVTEQHYAAWTRGRKARLERALAQVVMNPGRNTRRNRKPPASAR